MIETLILVFVLGIAIGSHVATRVVSAKARRLLRKRGNALREIKNHKWNVGDQNDAVVITRIALKGLEHTHRKMGK